MPTYTKEQKANRKNTIKARNILEILDSGSHPTPQGTIIHHPRAFNKPFSCELGRHQWETKAVMGIPMLVCKKCGGGVPRDVFNGVLTNREMRANVPDPIKNINKTDVITELVEKLNAKSRK